MQIFLNRLFAGNCRRISKDVDINPAAAFQAILAKERARSDRNNHCFSLVSFEVGLQDSSMDRINYLVDRLKKKLRVTDEIGWLDNHSIGVLLFNALSEEAMLFVEKVILTYPKENLFKYSISTYPGGKVEHCHNEGITCHDNLSSLTAAHGVPKTANAQIGLRLQPVFFAKSSFWKRFGDIVLSGIALVSLAPLLLALAIAVKCGTKGPVFFKQQRAGLGGVPFTFLKYRTMHEDAEARKAELLQFNQRTGPVFKMENDPRVTKLGKFLRKWSLDELPQLFNVFMGDMSLVGPRPPTMDEVEKYASWHNCRLEVKPGITCIWQVYARHEQSFENWVRLDIRYRQKQSFLFDMKLLALTLPAVLSRRGAC